MADKTTHFGRAGEFFAMSELLLRGWNVAVPVVDVGDDAFVIDDNDKTTWRLQVKSAEAETMPDGTLKASFSLSRLQLRTVQPIELFYMFLVRASGAWMFLVVPRADLAVIRKDYVDLSKSQPTRGRRPLADEDAKGDALTLILELKDSAVAGWKAALAKYLGQWPAELAPVSGGPGTVTRDTGDLGAIAEEAPVPSQDLEK